jgi:hypothetical protein
MLTSTLSKRDKSVGRNVTTRGQCYDHRFRQFLPFYAQKLAISLKTHSCSCIPRDSNCCLLSALGFSFFPRFGNQGWANVLRPGCATRNGQKVPSKTYNNLTPKIFCLKYFST